MTFKQKVLTALKERGIRVLRTEGYGNVKVLACFIDKADNVKFEALRYELERELESALTLSQKHGMNIVIVESNEE